MVQIKIEEEPYTVLWNDGLFPMNEEHRECDDLEETQLAAMDFLRRWEVRSHEYLNSREVRTPQGYPARALIYQIRFTQGQGRFWLIDSDLDNPKRYAALITAVLSIPSKGGDYTDCLEDIGVNIPRELGFESVDNHLYRDLRRMDRYVTEVILHNGICAPLAAATVASLLLLRYEGVECDGLEL